jgi:hypothetical protein
MSFGFPSVRLLFIKVMFKRNESTCGSKHREDQLLTLLFFIIILVKFRRNDTSGSKHREDRFHLNNLSFAGPVVMGVGGTIKWKASVLAE